MTDNKTTAIRERGPWRVVEYGKRIDIQSDDFTHDAALTISGDFAGHPERLAYAQEIASRLNLWRPA